MADLVLSLSLDAITCCQEGCGITFAAPESWIRKRREDHVWWYCPNGHTQHFPGETEAEKLKKQLAARGAELDRVRADRDAQIRTITSMKGQATKLRKRVAAGVCPCCKRTFQNLARHMSGQHPGFEDSRP